MASPKRKPSAKSTNGTASSSKRFMRGGPKVTPFFPGPVRSLPRHNHLLQPWLQIVAALAGIEDGDGKTHAGVTVRDASRVS